LTESQGLRHALRIWRTGRELRLDHARCCARVASDLLAQGLDRWQVLALSGALARARPMLCEEPTALGRRLRRVRPGNRQAVFRAAAGEVVPVWDGGGRKRRGAFDTPPELAGEVVRLALGAAEGPVGLGMDPACGTGAFLLALDQAGVDRIVGIDPDPVALAVAAVLVPRAHLVRASVFEADLVPADVVVGNPPFVSPERQDKALRRALAGRFPWLRGRFDLAVPFSELAMGALRPGGGLGLVLPAAMMVQPYGESWRRRWLEAHRVRSLGVPSDFPGVSVRVVALSATRGGGPGAMAGGLPVSDVLSLPAAPLDARVTAGDLALVQRVRAESVPLGELCHVDTGLVAHGPLGGKARLLRDAPEPGAVPFVDARDLFQGRSRWLAYRAQEMHRPKSPALFEGPKLLVQRLRGGGPVRALVDRSGVYAGHTLLVARPHPCCPVSPERLLEVVQDPVAQAVNRVERGPRLDLYPQDLRGLPVPRRWLRGEPAGLHAAWGLDAAQASTLARLASF